MDFGLTHNSKPAKQCSQLIQRQLSINLREWSTTIFERRRKHDTMQHFHLLNIEMIIRLFDHDPSLGKLKCCSTLKRYRLASTHQSCQTSHCGSKETAIVQRGFLFPEPIPPEETRWMEKWSASLVLNIIKLLLMFPRVPLAQLRMRESNIFVLHAPWAMWSTCKYTS